MPQAHPREVENFAAFYPFYLNEHRDPTCRRLHFAGSTVALLCLLALLLSGNGWRKVAGRFFSKTKWPTQAKA